MLLKRFPFTTLIIFLIYLNTVHSQAVYEHESNKIVTVVKYQVGNNFNYSENHYNKISIGKDDGSYGYSSEVYRTVVEFDLSDIPDGSRIDEAYLKVYLESYQSEYSIKIREFTGDVDSQTDSEIWNAINTGTTFYGNVPYNFYIELTNSDYLKKSILSSLISDKLRIGFLSNNENINGSSAKITGVTLHVEYSEKISITVTNSFDAGKFNVDDTLRSDGFISSYWYNGDIHKFENWDQNHSGEDYVF